MKLYLLNLTIFLTALSAGLFFSWAVSVMPGTKKVSDFTYMESMQSINKAIINPWFLAIFLGPLVLLILSSIGYYEYKQAFYPILVASLSYIIGTVGITAFGNVPMNETLDAISNHSLSSQELKEARLAYEGKWDQLHYIRTVFSVISFGLLLFAFNYANSATN